MPHPSSPAWARPIRWLIAVACLAGLSTAGISSLGAAPKPNLIVFLVDDMGVMDISVPFIAAWAKASSDNAHQQHLPIPPGALQSQQAAVQDLFPTLLDLAGAKSPRSHAVDGLKLDILLAGKRDPSRHERFLMHYPHAPHRSDYWTSLRDGEWKVIYHYFPSAASEHAHYQLFNLNTDPFEQDNLARSRPAELRRLMRNLVASLEQHQAVYPIDKDGMTPLKPKLP